MPSSPCNTGYSLEQVSVNGQGAIHPPTAAGGFLAFLLQRRGGLIPLSHMDPSNHSR
jgi:hypothetical protein